MARRIAAFFVTLGCLQAGAVSALGLGELTLDSFLNEPLKAKVDLLNTGGLNKHQIRIRLATSDDFDRMGVDRAYFLTSISFEVEVDDSGNGQIVLSSEGPVLEPYLDFIVEARWPSGRLLREYTVLIDPPVFDTTQTVTVSASEIADTVDSGSAPDKKKTQAEASSGTQVKVAKSDLPRGEMPQRDFGSNASANPEAGNRYMIRRDETLWAIALKSKPEGTSVHQAMLDIQRLNPAAFIDGNINRIKAGYVIYLPSSGDISSDNEASALEEVRQQNQDWRDGVPSESTGSSGGSLRISTEPEDQAATSGNAGSSAFGDAAADMASMESLELAERDRAEVEQRLNAMAEQVETLERIVSLKDEQIAALQNALAETGAGVDDQSSGVTEQAEVPGTEEAAPESDFAAMDAENDRAEPSFEVTAEPTPVATQPESSPVAETPAEDSGFMSNITYVVGALVAIGIAILLFLRRRGAKDEEEAATGTSDVFADIKLGDEKLEVDAEVDADSAVDEGEAEETAGLSARSRGYGERKNDEYAADIDAGDALAEADIYIAYGRFPQALDLLKTAIDNEPNNASYKLKLMEVSAELGDQAEVIKQYGDLKTLGDEDSLSKAEEIVQEMEGSAELQAPIADSEQDSSPAAVELADELDLPDLDLSASSEDLGLEDDFGSLEIEGFETSEDDEELDLSADFASASNEPVAAKEEEDMVFAADADVMSTKLDLARAYLDMGDQDGAKQIFEEVVAEGNPEQQEEARALLERLD